MEAYLFTDFMERFDLTLVRTNSDRARRIKPSDRISLSSRLMEGSKRLLPCRGRTPSRTEIPQEKTPSQQPTHEELEWTRKTFCLHAIKYSLCKLCHLAKAATPKVKDPSPSSENRSSSERCKHHPVSHILSHNLSAGISVNTTPLRLPILRASCS